MILRLNARDQPGVVLAHAIPRVPIVSREELVSAEAGERHLDVLARELRDVVAGYHRVGGEGSSNASTMSPTSAEIRLHGVIAEVTAVACSDLAATGAHR